MRLTESERRLRGLASQAEGKWVVVAVPASMLPQEEEMIAELLKQWQLKHEFKLLLLRSDETVRQSGVSFTADVELPFSKSQELTSLARVWAQRPAVSARMIGFSLRSAGASAVFHAMGIPTTLYVNEFSRKLEPAVIRSALQGAQRIVFSGIELLENFRTEGRKIENRPSRLPALQVVEPGLLPSLVVSEPATESRRPFTVLGVSGRDIDAGRRLFEEVKDAMKDHAECNWVWSAGRNFLESLANSDALLVCTSEDGYSQEATAALCLGKPILLFNATTGTEDFVKRSGGGLVFPAGDVESVAECLMDWIEHPDRAKAIGFADRSTAVQVYDFERFADRLWQRLHNDFVGRHVFKSHEEVAAILKNSAVRRGMPRQSTPAPDRRLIALSAKDHQRMRALLQPFFTPKFVQAFSPKIQELSRQLVDELPDNPEAVDWWNDFILPLTQTTLMQFVGLPDHLKMPLFRLFDSEVFAHPPEAIEIDHRAMMAEMHDGFLELVMPYIENPPENLTTPQNVIEMIQMAFRDGVIDRDEVCDLSEAIIRGGSGTSAQHMRQALAFLAARPAKWKEIRENPAKFADAIEELLRLNSTATSTEWMVAEADFEVAGRQVLEGDRIHILFAQANRDPSFFPDPDTLDIHRKNASKHLAFSHGVHHCLGAWLMRAEMTAALEHLTAKYPHFAMPGVEPM
jgi:cytochrome P450